MKKKNTLLLTSFLTILLLNSCAVVAVGAVATAAGTGAAVATDPRNSGIVVDDSTIANKLQSQLNTDLPKANTYVTCYNGVVLLTGQVANAKDKEKAVFDAKTIPGVRKIYDYLEVRLPQSFSSRANDSFITTQVKTKLIGLSNVKSNSIKVTTTNSVVYLFGIVTKEQAKKVEQAVADMNGVAKVVTLFEYVS